MRTATLRVAPRPMAVPGGAEPLGAPTAGSLRPPHPLATVVLPDDAVVTSSGSCGHLAAVRCGASPWHSDTVGVMSSPATTPYWGPDFDALAEFDPEISGV